MSADHLHLGDLRPDGKNARRHTPRNIGLISSALGEVGAARSIVIDEANTILAGNGVVEAAAQAGITKVQVVDTDGETLIAVRRRGLSARQKQRLALFDNRAGELAQWDADVIQTLRAADATLLEGLFSGDELNRVLRDLTKAAGATDPDAVPALPATTKTQRGDVFLLGRHRLMCGDATSPDDLARLMQGQRVECVFTSPPYAVGIDYGGYDDTIENLRAMLPQLSAAWMQLVVAGGYAVVNFGDLIAGREIAGSPEPCEYPMGLEYWPVFRRDGWTLWSRRVWCKPIAVVNSTRQCIASNRGAGNFEHIWTWKRPGRSIIQSQVVGEYQSQSAWFDTTHDGNLTIGLATHGAGMIAGVAERMIACHSQPGGAIHEPFAGTGTTMIAAERLSRTCYAMELSPRYVDLIRDRWEMFTGQTAVREDAGVAVDCAVAASTRDGAACPPAERAARKPAAAAPRKAAKAPHRS